MLLMAVIIKPEHTAPLCNRLRVTLRLSERSSETRIVLEIPHTMMTKIKAHAEQRGESLNGFICRAIENQLKQDEQEV